MSHSFCESRAAYKPKPVSLQTEASQFHPHQDPKPKSWFEGVPLVIQSLSTILSSCSKGKADSHPNNLGSACFPTEPFNLKLAPMNPNQFPNPFSSHHAVSLRARSAPCPVSAILTEPRNGRNGVRSQSPGRRGRSGVGRCFGQRRRSLGDGARSAGGFLR